jgi:hypothetical protein
MNSQLYMYSCACSLSSNRIDLYTVMTCECSQEYGRTALLWASQGGHSATVRVLVELGASLEAVDKVNIHAHALAHTCCIKHVSGIMRRTIIILSHARVYMYIYTFICRYVCMYIYRDIYIYIFNHHVCIYRHTHNIKL